MDRQDEKLANIQNDWSDYGNSSRRPRRNHERSEDDHSRSTVRKIIITDR